MFAFVREQKIKVLSLLNESLEQTHIVHFSKIISLIWKKSFPNHWTSVEKMLEVCVSCKSSHLDDVVWFENKLFRR